MWSPAALILGFTVLAPPFPLLQFHGRTWWSVHTPPSQPFFSIVFSCLTTSFSVRHYDIHVHSLLMISPQTIPFTCFAVNILWCMRPTLMPSIYRSETYGNALWQRYFTHISLAFRPTNSRVFRSTKGQKQNHISPLIEAKKETQLSSRERSLHVFTTLPYAISSAENSFQANEPAGIRIPLINCTSGCLERCAADCEISAMPRVLISSTRTRHSPMRKFNMQEMHTGIPSAGKHIISRHWESITRLHMSNFIMQDGTCGRGLQCGCGSQ